MDVTINNAADLKLEIARLKQIKNVQETAIKQHFNSPRAILGTIISIFHKHRSGDNTSLANFDLGSIISKFLLPFTLNKTLFRKSNFIVKALAGFVSQKASGLVNNKTMSTIWDKIRPHIPHSLAEKITPKKPSSFFSFLSPKRDQKPKKLRPV